MFTQPAGSFKRIIAVIIDHLIIIVFLAAIYTNYYHLDIANADLTNQQYLIFLGLTLGYFILQEWLFHKTIGKKIMGLRVVQVTGQSPDLISVLIRNVFRPIDMIGFYLLGYIIMAYSDLNQRLGDLIAGTYVIEE